MSPSSDIETLFGHFGGNAGDYQEIGRENEAGTARTRWPLLVTLDLKQTPIPAIAQHRERSASQGGPAGEAVAPHGEMEAATPAQNPVEGTASATPALRSKAPLFARPHRRNVPPVANVIKADAPRGGDRFGALPEVGALTAAGAAVHENKGAPGQMAPVPAAAPVVSGAATQPVAQPASLALPVAGAATTRPASLAASAAASATASAAAPAAAVPPVFSRPAAIVPASARTFAAGAIPPVPPGAPVAPVAARTGVPPVAPARNNPLAATAQPAALASFAARTSAASQPPSILGRLFASAAPQPAPAAPPRTGAGQPAELRSVFDRLRGAPSNTAAPASAPHSWLNNGPRRS